MTLGQATTVPWGGGGGGERKLTAIVYIQSELYHFLTVRQPGPIYSILSHILI